VDVVLCTCCMSGALCRWCYVHVVYVVMCTCGGAYMFCMWYCVPVVLCTCGTMVQHTYVVVYMLCGWFRVHVMLCTHCEGGVWYMWQWRMCGTKCMSNMLCCHGIMTCVFIVLYSMWVHVLCGVVH